MTETQALPTLTCLKCGAPMRTYERSGVLIDQCTECRGIFLDRGELDRLIDAEAFAARPAAEVPVGPPAAVAPMGRPAAAAQDEPRRSDDARRSEGGQRPDHRDHDERDDDEDRREDDDARRRAISQSAVHGAGTPSRKRGGLFGDVLDMFGGGE